MSRSIRLVAATALLAMLAFTSAGSTIAGGAKLLDAPMVGIPTAGLVLNGLTGGGVAWTIDDGRAKLYENGRVDVDVEGLVLATTGTNPIANGRAVVTCGDTPVASSPIVAFSPTGDASVSTTVELPDTCLAPAVFFVGVLPTGAERWFAVTGF